MLTNQSEVGFTFIELLYVLLIVSLLTFISMPIVYQAYIDNETNQFFIKLDSDILYIQNQGLADKEFSIHFEDDQYLFYEDTKVVYRRQYPNHITFKKYSTTFIRFNNLGTVMDPTTFHFYDDDYLYRLIFPLGKGRHYIEKY